MSEVKEYIRKKKRKKARRRFFMTITIVVITVTIFFTQAPIFNISKIEIAGATDVTLSSIKKVTDGEIGKNIFLVKRKEIKEKLLSNKYFKSVDIEIAGINKLKVTVNEEAPIYYIAYNENYYILNERVDILEISDTVYNEKMVEIKGLSVEGKKVGDSLDDSGKYSSVLKTFYPYIEQNTEELKLNALDISNVANIKGYMGEVEIIFGDESGLHTKMNEVYNIMMNETIGLTKGYINVSYEGNPIIKKE